MSLPNSIPGVRHLIACDSEASPHVVGVSEIANAIETALLSEETDPLHFNRPAYAVYDALLTRGITGNALLSFFEECGRDVYTLRAKLGLGVWMIPSG